MKNYPCPDGDRTATIRPAASLPSEESRFINVTGKFSKSGIETCVNYGLKEINIFGNIIVKYVEKLVKKFGRSSILKPRIPYAVSLLYTLLSSQRV